MRDTANNLGAVSYERLVKAISMDPQLPATLDRVRHLCPLIIEAPADKSGHPGGPQEADQCQRNNHTAKTYGPAICRLECQPGAPDTQDRAKQRDNGADLQNADIAIDAVIVKAVLAAQHRREQQAPADQIDQIDHDGDARQSAKQCRPTGSDRGQLTGALHPRRDRPDNGRA